MAYIVDKHPSIRKSVPEGDKGHPLECDCGLISLSYTLPSLGHMEAKVIQWKKSIYKSREVLSMVRNDLSAKDKSFEAITAAALKESSDAIDAMMESLILFLDTEETEREAYQEFLSYLQYQIEKCDNVIEDDEQGEQNVFTATSKKNAYENFIKSFTTRHDGFPVVA